MKKLGLLYKNCRKSGTSVISLLIRYCYYRISGKLLLLHQRAIIKGSNNIITMAPVSVGTSFVGFCHRKDYTYLHIEGQLLFKGKFAIGRGCRFDIGMNAKVTIGSNGFINPFTNIIITDNLTIGDDVAISWNCQILDNDFHEVHYEGKKQKSNNIVIGNKVWIGSNVSIYKGAVIPDGCVVAANSVVRNSFSETNCIIGGNPAKVIKSNISWS
ncbi:acyltransferase [Chitinophaga sp. sic0106]|uniref:acyltransferase n=1 Tax=Chitinophaga sp. sic0106 TaxID=2854785 RepID=UPI001C436EFE|nr:acyltransferase [Chitinophaga sp. sic0106]MBV7529013.1 acyltransferase [Chitinophaga sp. sic0106]